LVSLITTEDTAPQPDYGDAVSDRRAVGRARRIAISNFADLD
jgi:hypothetical protein